MLQTLIDALPYAVVFVAGITLTVSYFLIQAKKVADQTLTEPIQWPLSEVQYTGMELVSDTATLGEIVERRPINSCISTAVIPGACVLHSEQGTLLLRMPNGELIPYLRDVQLIQKLGDKTEVTAKLLVNVADSVPPVEKMITVACKQGIFYIPR